MPQNRIINQRQLKALFTDADVKISKEGLDYLIDYAEKFLQDFASSDWSDFDKVDAEAISLGWGVWFPTDEEEEETETEEGTKNIDLKDYFDDHMIRLIEAFAHTRPDTINWLIKFGKSVDEYISDEAKIVAKTL
jgi:hypothetical protein